MQYYACETVHYDAHGPVRSTYAKCILTGQDRRHGRPIWWYEDVETEDGFFDYEPLPEWDPAIHERP